MRLASIPRLRCPSCLGAGVEAPLELDPIRIGGGEDGGVPGDVVEAYLVCTACRTACPVVSGLAILPRDVLAHLERHGNVYRRTPIADPRLTRFVLGNAGGGYDAVPFEEVLEHYGDLLPAPSEAPARPLCASDAALDAVLKARAARGPSLEVGTGVGRGTFLLAGRTGDATGVDRSVARVRRARNVQMAVEFRLPLEPGARAETPIDLTRLSRDATDLLVADPEALPFASGAFATVVVRARDGMGPWADAAAVAHEARRVAGPAGLVLEEAPGAESWWIEVPGGAAA